MPKVFRRTVAFLVLLLAAPWGCGQSNPDLPRTTHTSGTVTYQGKPLEKGTITFISDTGHLATGELQPDGTYELTTFEAGDGAVVGHHRVKIVADTADPNLMPGSSPGYKPPKELIPKKYADAQTSGLEATVGEESKPIDFTLQ